MQTTIYLVLAFAMGLIMSIYLPIFRFHHYRKCHLFLRCSVNFGINSSFIRPIYCDESSKRRTGIPVFNRRYQRICGSRHNLSHSTNRRAEIFHFADHRSNTNGDCRKPFWIFGISQRSCQYEKDDWGNTCFNGRNFFYLLMISGL